MISKKVVDYAYHPRDDYLVLHSSAQVKIKKSIYTFYSFFIDTFNVGKHQRNRFMR